MNLRSVLTISLGLALLLCASAGAETMKILPDGATGNGIPDLYVGLNPDTGAVEPGVWFDPDGVVAATAGATGLSAFRIVSNAGIFLPGNGVPFGLFNVNTANEKYSGMLMMIGGWNPPDKTWAYGDIIDPAWAGAQGNLKEALVHDLEVARVTLDGVAGLYDMELIMEGTGPHNVPPMLGDLGFPRKKAHAWGPQRGPLVVDISATDENATDQLTFNLESIGANDIAPGWVDFVDNGDRTAQFTFHADRGHANGQQPWNHMYEVQITVDDNQGKAVDVGTFQILIVPEPSTMLMLLSTGVLGLLLWWKRRS